MSVAAILVVIRLFLPVIAKYYANEQLNQDPAYRGNVESVSLHLWRGAYSANNLRIERVEGQKTFPLLSIAHTDVGIAWKDLLRLHFVAKVHLNRVVANIVAEQSESGPKVVVGEGSKQNKKKEAESWHQVFKNLIPLNISQLLIEGDSLHFRDVTVNPPIDIYLDELKVTGENLTNSKKVSKTLFGEIDLKARALKSGQLAIQVMINPITVPTEMKLTLRLEHLNLTELNRFFKAYGKFDVKRGKFDLYSELVVADNKIEGYAKPFSTDLEVADFKEDSKKGLLHAFWQEIVDLIATVFKNHPNDRQAARIPFSGKLDDPNVDIWSTLGSIFKNMFIAPIAPKVENSVHLKNVKAK